MGVVLYEDIFGRLFYPDGWNDKWLQQEDQWLDSGEEMLCFYSVLILSQSNTKRLCILEKKKNLNKHVCTIFNFVIQVCQTCSPRAKTCTLGGSIRPA